MAVSRDHKVNTLIRLRARERFSAKKEKKRSEKIVEKKKSGEGEKEEGPTSAWLKVTGPPEYSSDPKPTADFRLPDFYLFCHLLHIDRFDFVHFIVYLVPAI